MITPDMNSISGQNRLPPSATPARSAGLTRPAMIASATPMPICDSCVTIIGSAKLVSALNSRRASAFSGACDTCECATGELDCMRRRLERNSRSFYPTPRG